MGGRADQVAQWFQSLLAKVEGSLGGIPFGFLSIKPSPARRYLFESIRRANAEIRELVERHESAYLIDIYPAMPDAGGNPRVEVFAEDGLHLTRATRTFIF